MKTKIKLPESLKDFDKARPRKPLPELPPHIHFPRLNAFLERFGADVEDVSIEWPLSLRPLTNVEFEVVRSRPPHWDGVLPAGLTTLYYANISGRRMTLRRITAYVWRDMYRRLLQSDSTSSEYLLMTTRPLTKLWKSGDLGAIKAHLTEKFGTNFQ